MFCNGGKKDQFEVYFLPSLVFYRGHNCVPFSKPFQLAVDASAIGMKAVLMQVEDNGINHPVSFYSKKLDKHQQNYSVVEKEALSLLSALRYYNVHL